jgi:RimJ/RimL family protein N-acetyltransferase
VLADESDRWRDLRIRALADAPEAFSTTVAEASAWDDHEWQRRTEAFAAGSDRAMFVAEVGDRWVGCAGAYRETGPHEVISVWVAPDHRGCGVGETVVGAAVAWSRSQGATRVVLHVMPENLHAIAMYERLGFRLTGRLDPSRDPAVLQAEMAVDLLPNESRAHT